MKKSFLLLPVSIAILTACSSNSPAPIENVDGTLSPGVMQPVDNNSSGTWQPEIQQNTMPNTMGNSVPTGTQTPQPRFQPTYQPYNNLLQHSLNQRLLQLRFNHKLKQ